MGLSSLLGRCTCRSRASLHGEINGLILAHEFDLRM
jgi:hypothetical protein